MNRFCSARDHVEALRPHLLPGSIAQRLHALSMLERATPATLDRLAPELCAMAVASSKQVRAAAASALRRCGPAVSAPLRESIKERDQSIEVKVE
mgnify:CR=1 FL=1